MTADALRQAGLLLSHEGIHSVIAYLAVADPLLYRLVKAVHRFGIEKGVDLVSATSVLDSRKRENAMKIAARVATVLRESHQNFVDIISIENALIDVLGE